MPFFTVRDFSFFAGTDLSQLFSTRTVATVAGPLGWVPKATVINNGTLLFSAAPGGGKSYAAKIQLNEVDAGSAVTVSNASTSARAVLGPTLPAASSGTTPDSFNISSTNTGAPATQDGRMAVQYTVAAPDSTISWFGSGDDAFNTGFGAGADVFVGINWNQSSSSTEPPAQVLWPIAGVLKYLLLRFNAGAGTTFDFALRKNNADSALKFTGVAGDGATHLLTDLSDTVAVAAGDVIAFRYKRTAGASGNFTYFAAFGFSQS